MKESKLVISLFFVLSVFMFETILAQDSKLFDYNKKLSFDVKEISSKTENGVVVKDISFATVNNPPERINAYLVEPEASGKYAAIFFFHWLGEKNSNRNEFLEEAKILAKGGVVSFLIDGYFPWKKQPADPKVDKKEVIDQTIEVRRALDYLLLQKSVDKKRVAYVGHDYGAMYGAILSGIEKRIQSYVLITGMGNFSNWSLKYWKQPKTFGEEIYRKTLNEVDPLNYLPKATSANFYFQFAEKDIYISKEKAAEFSSAAKNKEVKFYEAEHDLQIESARIDRMNWLSKRLKLASKR